MEEMAGGPDADTERLRDIRSLMRETGTQGSFVLDPSITRGLDYYTGVVYETFLNDLPSIGSVCSGGRYDNLAGLYMKDRVPGVGSSIGLDRLMAGLEELNSSSVKASFTEAAVFLQDGADLARSVALARELRRAGIACEVFPEPKKMAQQYAWAEKKGIPFGILPAQNGAGWAIKNLVTRESLEAAGAAEVIGALRRT
jgi:histidyl-tRNA synthetase